MEDLSLPELFEMGIKDKSLDQLFECKRRIDILGLFSSNEDIEEISTESLQYLSCSYHLALSLISKKSNVNDKKIVNHHDHHLQRLKEALSLMKEFINRISIFEGFINAHIIPIISPTSPTSSSSSSPLTPEKKRERKISIRKIIDSIPNDTINIDKRFQEIQSIKKIFYSSLLEVDIIESEILLLENNLSLKEDVNDVRMNIRMNSKSSIKTFKLLPNNYGFQQRDQIKVFGSSHLLPTMTVDQYLKEERLKGGIIDGSNTKDDVVEEEEDREENEEDEEERKRLIRMDEFKDNVKRGSGNRYRRS